MNSVFIFSENGDLVGETLSSVNEALGYLNNNIREIMENNRVNSVYVIVDFENKTSNFVKYQFNVVPA